ncbi:ergothioneine biosynthesis glutamate--cysteine ligase EgtA [Rhodococcus sp. MEB064]|uniref:ergothioneine biosynthesis glutamate--cysteine ligase EgtA n=1 Tax=Rhodococcus sp. MEB064 TaxID=1587522 RepID=UPI0005ACE8BF|nr:ergothioneine biosynthesis glutamate--cysteine ligase EgtA [Rhodococcus sp. MEB064]
MTSTSPDVSSRPAAETYIARVCFKVGPPRLIGAELEWFTRTATGTRPSLDAVAEALGVHTPQSLRSDSPALALRSGSIVSVEPGGQIELSSAPATTIDHVVDSLAGDHRLLVDLLATQGITLDGGGADAVRDPERLLTLPRYCAMERRFQRHGPYGKLMMCNTAAVQVSIDAGEDSRRIRDRWDTVHAIGPALLAAFATTPVLHGVPEGKWASQRMRTWFELDRTRTRVPLGVDPASDYARWVMDVPLLCVRRGGTLVEPPEDSTFAQWIAGDLDEELGRRPTTADLDYHLTTVFPLVRASGHLEIRYLDGQPDGLWDVPMYAVDALLSTEAVAAEARDLARHTMDRWEDAARDGLADTDIRVAAHGLLTLAADTAHGAAAERLADAAHRCAAGRAPTAMLDDSRQEFSR